MVFRHETQCAAGRSTFVCTVVCDACAVAVALGSEWRQGYIVPASVADGARLAAQVRAVTRVVTTGLGSARDDGAAECRACRDVRAAAPLAWGDAALPDGIPYVVATPLAPRGFRVELRVRIAGILGTGVCVVPDEQTATARVAAWRAIAPAALRAIRDIADAAAHFPDAAEALERARRDGVRIAVGE